MGWGPLTRSDTAPPPSSHTVLMFTSVRNRPAAVVRCCSGERGAAQCCAVQGCAAESRCAVLHQKEGQGAALVASGMHGMHA